MDQVHQVYLDYAATTPLDDRVLERMLPYFRDVFGNPSSIHQFGQRAEAAIEDARHVVGQQINAHPDEIIFTACGTESDNLALRGVAFAQRARGRNHILITPVEHHAVLHTAQQLRQYHGFEVEELAVDASGRVDPQTVAASIRADTALVSVIYANNEIGTINPIGEIGRICQDCDVPLHTDAVQAAAHCRINVEFEHIALLSIGAHKFYGPKGVGALYIRKGTPIMPVQTGGKQENGLRAGTQNVPYIVGLAEAFRQVTIEQAKRTARLSLLRDHLIGSVLEEIPGAFLTGHPELRLPNHASFVFENVDGNLLLQMLDAAGFACSSGSACKTGNPQPSEVLTAIGLSARLALGSLRVTLGNATTIEDVEAFVGILPELVRRVRMLK